MWSLLQGQLWRLQVLPGHEECRRQRQAEAALPGEEVWRGAEEGEEEGEGGGGGDGQEGRAEAGSDGEHCVGEEAKETGA